MKEFNLSEKSEGCTSTKGRMGQAYFNEDVKEFIKRERKIITKAHLKIGL